MAGAGSDTIIDSELMQFAPLIILLPMLAFPVILFLGRVFNRNPFWKDTMKAFFFRSKQNWGNQAFYPKHDPDDTIKDILLSLIHI